MGGGVEAEVAQFGRGGSSLRRRPLQNLEGCGHDRVRRQPARCRDNRILVDCSALDRRNNSSSRTANTGRRAGEPSEAHRCSESICCVRCAEEATTTSERRCECGECGYMSAIKFVLLLLVCPFVPARIILAKSCTATIKLVPMARAQSKPVPG
ncbi:hypothetical protein PsYK624_074520 [Phanerochaete sordida]|uniref:Uncharacterized protein n=1 Tax=Phanerochaete sordida TaxID=48140 RepID=A0A9P3LEA5_9APHY|nr:hypothetical protein PsYK624_074520 [Phanerochaete sordida]